MAQDGSALTADVDVWRAAKLFIDRHGKTASVEAAVRAERLAAEGDLEGQAVWVRISKAIEELQNTKPEGPVH